MRVVDLITMLVYYQEAHGPNAQIGVPSTHTEWNGKEARVVQRKEIFIYDCPIATYLDSRGPEVEY